MLFSSQVFIFFFFPIVVIVYFLLHGHKSKNIFLLFASLFFYAWGEPYYVFLMIGSIVINFGFALLISKSSILKKKILLAICIILNISVFIVFKYLGFFTSIMNSVLKTSIPLLNIALPIGISFFTFQAMSYVIDIYRKPSEVQENVLNVGLYISLFPQLIAGPIVRYNTISAQINNRIENLDDVFSGLFRFLIGFSKKILLANNIAIVADKAFLIDPNLRSVGFAWLGVIAYAMQIYFDFSAYSDMAIGMGRMFGFHFDENFSDPYLSKSVTEFWRRWHISLGTWFRDYLYFPLGGSKTTKVKHMRNLLITWFLTGLWHGASWNFVLWGIYYFLIILIEKKLKKDKCETTYAMIRTFLLVILGWVLFRSLDLESAIKYYTSMFTIRSLPIACADGLCPRIAEIKCPSIADNIVHGIA